MKNKSRPEQRMNFIQKSPREFALLNCLRKSLFTDDNFQLSLGSKFSMNIKEYKIWGQLAEQYKLIEAESTPNGRYRCRIPTGVLSEMAKALSKIKIGLK